MRIDFLTPTHQSHARGNTVTVNRWAEGLTQRGHVVRVLENFSADEILKDLPDIVHAHHAVHCGPTGATIKAASPRTGFVISLGGTDLNGPEGTPSDIARQSLSAADAVVGPFAEDGLRLKEALSACPPFFVVPRGVFPKTSSEHRFVEPLRGVVLGGIRPVKGQLDAIRWAQLAREAGIGIELSFAGPIIDEDYGRDFKAAVDSAPHANYVGVLAAEMASHFIEDSDFLLNASWNEGASNAILESLSLGRPVAARHAPGNREMLRDAPPSVAHLIRDNEIGLHSWFGWLKELLTADPEVAHQTARNFVEVQYSPEAEMDALLEAYGQIKC